MEKIDTKKAALKSSENEIDNEFKYKCQKRNQKPKADFLRKFSVLRTFSNGDTSNWIHDL